MCNILHTYISRLEAWRNCILIQYKVRFYRRGCAKKPHHQLIVKLRLKKGFLMIINKYITKEVLLNFIAITGILLFVALSNRFVNLLAKVAIGQLPGNLVFKVVGLYSRIIGFPYAFRSFCCYFVCLWQITR